MLSNPNVQPNAAHGEPEPLDRGHPFVPLQNLSTSHPTDISAPTAYDLDSDTNLFPAKDEDKRDPEGWIDDILFLGILGQDTRYFSHDVTEPSQSNFPNIAK